MVRVCIVGAGVVGLSTAWQVLEQIKDATVVVYAEKFTTQTTSHGAAGIFQPQPGLTKVSNFDQLCQNSWSFFDGIVKTNEARNAGISVMDGYQLYTQRMPLEEENYRKFVYHFAEVEPDSLTFLPNASNIVQAYHYTTLLIECRRYLPWMMKKLEYRGVKFVQRFLTSLGELAVEDFDVIFNCAGLGNQALTGDHRMYPIRGQLIRVHAPWVKQFFMLGDSTYMFPGQDLLILGGCRQAGNYNTKVKNPTPSLFGIGAKSSSPALQGPLLITNGSGFVLTGMK